MATATTTSPSRSSRIKKATREQSKLRMAIDGPSGSGKTYTALRFAFALGKRVLVIDTEHGSASKYVGEMPDGETDDEQSTPWEFDTIQLSSFSPSEYQDAIEEGGACGYDVIVVDSLSHAWEGKDGALELKDRKGGNSFTAWKDITPMHRRMVEAILQSPCHVIATMRSKTEYVVEVGDNGKSVPRRVGMAPVQRQGMESDFDISGSLDWSHLMTVSKTRCRAIDGRSVVKPGAAFMRPIIDWLQTGTQSSPVAVPARQRITDEQIQEIANLAGGMGWDMTKEVAAILPSKFQVTELTHLSPKDGDELIKWMKAKGRVVDTHHAAKPATPAEPTNGAAATKEQPPKPPAEGAGFELPEPGAILDEQAAAIKARYQRLVELGMPKSAYKEKILAKRGVQSARELTREQAEELIDSMTRKIAQMETAQGIKHVTHLDDAAASGSSQPAAASESAGN